MSWKQKWFSDTSRDWDRRVRGFPEHHLAAAGSLKGILKGISIRDAARGWAVVQVDHDEEPLYAICDTLLAESEELMASTMALALLIVFGEEEEDSFDQRRHTRISGYIGSC